MYWGGGGANETIIITDQWALWGIRYPNSTLHHLSPRPPGDTTEELCSRWMELGAFYPFSRNHNSKGRIAQVKSFICSVWWTNLIDDDVVFSSLKEPYRWISVTAISKKVLGIRYSLLPYYYTLFYKAHRSVDSLNAPAATVVRPLFFEFPKDSHTYSIDTQFLVGSGILISPQLSLGKSTPLLIVFLIAIFYTTFLTALIVICNRWSREVFGCVFPSGQVVWLVHTSSCLSKWRRN